MTPESTSLGLDILSKANAVITELERSGEGSVNEIAETVGEPVSSTYRLLSNLREMGWVDDAPQHGRYRLGLQFLQIASQVEDLKNPQEEALPRLKRLNQETQLTTYLCVQQGTDAVCVGRYDGRSVRSLVLTLGGSLPLDMGASGKALLAQLPEAEQESVLAQLGYQKGSEPLVLRMEELWDSRKRGMSISDEDVTVGIAALGAPIFNFRGETVASISVSGLRSAVLESPEIEGRLRRAAAEINNALGYEEVHDAPP